ncbi:MAG TPA: SRPBCC family protein [Candidatus Bathyarchaeia archaeon]|nr:SRPBCC family protein [Candidatus Bathyarchaeia archaeon]
MVSITISESVNASPEKVFSFVSDFEKAPQYSKYWKSVNLLKREGNTATYGTEAEAEGRKMVSVTKITSTPNERMETETVDGDGKGTKLTFSFQSIPQGTQITLEGEVVLPGFAKMLGSLVKGRIESGMREELKIIKNAVEKP